jgi:hypothetical protein
MEAGTLADTRRPARRKTPPARKARHTNFAFAGAKWQQASGSADSVTAWVAPAAGWRDGCPLDGERSGAGGCELHAGNFLENPSNKMLHKIIRACSVQVSRRS